MSEILKNVIKGMGSVVVVSPSKLEDPLDANDYLHSSANEAIMSDWNCVGSDLIVAAKESSTLRVKKK